MYYMKKHSTIKHITVFFLELVQQNLLDKGQKKEHISHPEPNYQN